MLHFSFLNKQVTIILYLFCLCFDFTVIGWILNGYSASQFILIGTTAIICYVVWVGGGAVALASIWVIGLISVATLRQQWFHDIPRQEYKLIPFALLASWLFALLSIWWLAKVSDYLRQHIKSAKVSFFLLVFFVMAFLSIGWSYYNQILFYFWLN